MYMHMYNQPGTTTPWNVANEFRRLLLHLGKSIPVGQTGSQVP